MKKNSVFGLVATALLCCAPLTLLNTGCVDDRGDEEELPADEDGKADSARRPTDHGVLSFGNAVVEELTSAVRFHAWQFELSADAQIDTSTSYALRGQRRVDTVMYLYKEGPNGWGPYIARNDNDGNRVYSRIKKSLSAGRYRVMVKGYAAATKGKFTTQVLCSGEGCATVGATNCLFGSTYREALMTPGLRVQQSDVLTLANSALVSEQDQEFIVRAVKESAATDVTTWQEALGRVDGQEMNRTVLVDSSGLRFFVAFEFGAGDNSYGAIFNLNSGERAAAIRDGDLYECEVARDNCLLSPNYTALRASTSFEVGTDRFIGSTADMNPVEQAQALAALQSVNASITDLASGLLEIDGGSLRFTSLRHVATNTALAAVEFHAGGTSVGQIYFGESTQAAGNISDGDISACTLFEAKGTGRLQPGDSCRATTDCSSGLLCEGIFAGAGVCISNASIPGQDNQCSSDTTCGSAALVCSGITRFANDGLCQPAWMRATFDNLESQGIPDNSSLTSKLAVRGLATVDTDVVVSATISHPAASQLLVTLQNPAGTQVEVYRGQAIDNGMPLVITKQTIRLSGDETVNGEWRLRVTDQRSREIGTLNNWSLTITSRYD
jgi:subtilisin-like proprotein convertase family protein